MRDEEFSFTEQDLRLRAQAAGIVFDEAQIPAVAKSVAGALAALATFDARKHKFSEPPHTFDARVTR